MQYLEEKDYSEHFDASLWRRLLRHAKPFHRHLVCTAALMGVSALIDAVFPLMTRYAIDHFITGATTEGLAAFIAVYVGLVAAQVAAIYFFLRIAGRIEVGVCYLIRKEGFERLQELPFAYYDRTPVGYIMARMTSDAQRLSDTIGWSLLDLCWGAFYLVFTAIAMFSLHWKLALCVMLVLPPLAAVSWYFQKRLLKSYRQVRKTNSQITGAFNEGIMGAKTTKTLVREEANYQEFTVLTQRMYTSSVRAATLSAIYLPIVISLGMLATAYAVWKGGYDVFTGLVTLGTLQVFVNYTVSFFEPVQQIARIFADLQSSQAAAERVMTLIEAEPELKDSPEVVRRYGDSFAPKRENWPALEGSVEFDHVSFRYKEGESVLEDFNLSVRAGETIALVGETGSDCCAFQCVYPCGGGKMSIGALKHSHFCNWGETWRPYLSPLYRAERYTGELPEDQKYMKILSEALRKEPELGRALFEDVFFQKTVVMPHEIEEYMGGRTDDRQAR